MPLAPWTHVDRANPDQTTMLPTRSRHMRSSAVLFVILAWFPAPLRAQMPDAAAGTPRSWAAPPHEDAVYREAAATAMNYLRAFRAPRTGLVSATPGWANITLWDIGSLIGAVYAAGELDLLNPSERDEWMGTLLQTLG